jgi:hypothetical protein
LNKRAIWLTRPTTGRQSPFANSLFPFVASNLAPHHNPVTCILAGLDRPLAVCTHAEQIEGDIVVIRPGVEYCDGSAKVLCKVLDFGLVKLDSAREREDRALVTNDNVVSARPAAQVTEVDVQ